MPDRTPYQSKLIGRYYDHRDNILLTRLQEIVTELVLADCNAARTRLWSRADKAMAALRVPKEVREHIVKQADPEVLARNVRDWLAAGKNNPGKMPTE